jgi:hypothetical protein
VKTNSRFTAMENDKGRVTSTARIHALQRLDTQLMQTKDESEFHYSGLTCCKQTSAAGMILQN